jgi:enamidase
VKSGSGNALIIHCGRIISGNIAQPFVSGDTIAIRRGRIAAVGRQSDVDSEGIETVIDALGVDAMPGLIDPHIHPIFGDWMPRFNAHGWMAHYAQAGVTTAISQGAVYLDGYPKDKLGMLSLVIALQRSYANFRPGGMKVHGAALSLVEGLQEEDFALLQAEGISNLAEIGVNSVVEISEVRRMVEIAHRHGFHSCVHFGPRSTDASHNVTADMALGFGAQIAVHVNGGPTSPPLSDVERLMDESECFLELCYTGNHKMATVVAEQAIARGIEHRLILGTDSPTGAGITPRGILRMINLLASFCRVPAAAAIAMGTGNTARAYGLECGMIAPGREADILLIDAPRDSTSKGGLEAIEAGDVPSIGMLMIDGEIVSWQTSNTLPGKTQPALRESATR